MPNLFGFLGYAILWSMRARSRRALAKLESHELDDIAMTEQQRDDEVAKWFWEGVPPRRKDRRKMATYSQEIGSR